MKKIFLTALALATLTQSSWAILDEHKIDLKTAIEKALETNPQMQMLDMDVEISKNKTKQVTRFQNPSIDVFQSMGSAIKTEPQTIGSSLLVEVMKRGKRKQVAKVQEDIALNKKNFSKYDLILEVRKAYIDLLLKKSNLNIRKQQQKLAQELYESIQKDVKEGKVPQTEALQAKIALNRSIMDVNSAKSNVIFSQNRFNTVMNTSDVNYDTKEDKLNGNYLDLMTIQPTNDMLKFDEIKSFAIQRRFDLQKAREEVVAAQKNLDLIKSQLVPDVQISGGYGYKTSSNSDNGSYVYGAYVGASIVNIPLFYQYQPEIKNAKLEIEKAQLKYKDVEIDAIRNITDAWEKFVITRENLNFYNSDLLANSKELMNVSIQSLGKKEIDLTAFLVSKKTYFELMLGYQQALADYYISFAELVKEMNIIEIEQEFI